MRESGGSLRADGQPACILSSAAPLPKKRRAQGSLAHQRGTRGKESRQNHNKKRSRKRLILDNSFHDRENEETICLVELGYSVRVVPDHYPFYEQLSYELTEKGEILTDSRGRGTFQ
jgi:hypothetical protein